MSLELGWGERAGGGVPEKKRAESVDHCEVCILNEKPLGDFAYKEGRDTLLF